jgi:hypothetical protein
MQEFLRQAGVALNYQREMLIAALILIRTMPVIMLTPWLAGKLAPNEVKMGVGGLLTILIWPLARETVGDDLPLTAGPFLMLMIKEVFEIFCRDESFRRQMDQWGADIVNSQQHHVPDIWGYRGSWMRFINRYYHNLSKPKTTILDKLIFYWLKMISRIDVAWGKAEHIYVDGRRKRLKDVVSYLTEGSVKFHKSSDPAWFGGTCNHFVSHKFLKIFSDKLEKFNMYEVVALPFSASALEINWGLIPGWLGFDKWFFNGIHRVRENFASDRREDDQEGMARYLNRYYRGKINVSHDGPYIKINKAGQKYNRLEECLNSYYYYQAVAKVC